MKLHRKNKTMKTYPLQIKEGTLQQFKIWAAMSNQTLKDFIIESVTDRALRENLPMVIFKTETQEIK